MRIELQHWPNCQFAEKLRSVLEEIIADERLPLAIEVVESENEQEPVVRICASGADSQSREHEIKYDGICEEGRKFHESLRSVVLEKWHDYAIFPLSQFH